LKQAANGMQTIDIDFAPAGDAAKYIEREIAIHF